MAKKTKESFFTKILIASAIFLGWVLAYSYIIWNSIQPQAWVVEKIYAWIFSSAENISSDHGDINIWFDLESHLEIKQEKTVLLDASLGIKNAQLYANQAGLNQRVSAESIILNTNKEGKIENYSIENLDVITSNHNVYILASKWLESINSIFWLSQETQSIIEKVSQINQNWKYAHIDNSQPIQDTLSKLWNQHVVIKLISALTTSNPQKYFEENNISNLLKQRLYNDKWIDYVFKKNEKISDTKTHYFILNKQICEEITPFMDLFEPSQSWSINSSVWGMKGCEQYIWEMNPFIALVSQIYKNWDIENGNYDFVISQWTQLDIRLKYSNHILQNWNIFIQNPQNSFKISILWDKFGIKESQIDIDYINNKSTIIWNIVNGTWNISVNIDDKSNQINGNLIFQKYLLIDMDLKWKSELENGNMRFLADWDYKSGKIDYTVKKSWEILNALNVKYTDANYKIDYISPEMNMNSLYAKGKFILGFSQKLIQEKNTEISKEIKYVYDQWKIKWHYRTSDFEGNLNWEILSLDEFIFNLGMKQNDQELTVKGESKQNALNTVEYIVEGTMDNEKLFLLNAQNMTEWDVSNISATVEIPNEKLDISFESKMIYNSDQSKYNIPSDIENIQINLDQIVPIINLHHINKINTPEVKFATAGIITAGGTMSYLSLRWNSREEKNNKIIQDFDTINNAVNRFIQTNTWTLNYRSFINELDTNKKDVWIRIWGDKLFPWDEYLVWSINYDLFALDKSVIEQDDIQYKIAILNLPETKNYQILGFLDEVWSKQKVITKWNYVPREFIRYDFEIVLPEDSWDDKDQSSIQIKINSDHHLKIWDVTNLGRILDIVDGVIFIENAVNPDISKIYLLWNDSPTLFINKNSAFEADEIITKK